MDESELKSARKRTSVQLINLLTSSSDDDFIRPRMKRKRSTEASLLSSEFIQMKESLDKVFLLTSSMTIPIGLKNILYETFKCSICQSTPMVPPIIFAKCCKCILGCQTCVDTWYRGEEGQTRTCPKCRSDRAYVETCKMHGIDDFLIAIAPLFGQSSTQQ